MNVDELEVYLTADGLGRAAIVRRSDGFLCIYVHWKLSQAVIKAQNIDARGSSTSWFNDSTPLALLYEDIDPEPGLYGMLDDARRQIRGLRGFSDAVLKT
jgi:hypothetical protein